MLRTLTVDKLLKPVWVMEKMFIVVVLLLLAASCRPAEAQNGWSFRYWSGNGQQLRINYQPPQNYNYYRPQQGNCGQQQYTYSNSRNNYKAQDRELQRQDKVLRAQDRVLRERDDVGQAYAKWQGLRRNSNYDSERDHIRWQRNLVAAERNLLRQQNELAEAERTLREASWGW